MVKLHVWAKRGKAIYAFNSIHFTLSHSEHFPTHNYETNLNAYRKLICTCFKDIIPQITSHILQRWILFKFFFIICMHVCLHALYVTHACSTHRGQRESLKLMLQGLWVLGTEPKSSSRAVSALNCWTSSPLPRGYSSITVWPKWVTIKFWNIKDNKWEIFFKKNH